MNILLTGGAGFMGSHMVKHLLERYPTYRVVVYDKLTYAGNLDNLASVAANPRYSFIRGDIGDAEAIARAIQEHRIEVIINYAAETHVDRSIIDPAAFLRTDIFGVYTLLEAVKQFGLQKMVQISTDEVFGSIATGAFTEESPFAPNSPYSASKAGGDLLCRSYYVTFGTPVIVTHSCNFYGPYQYPEKFIPLFITNLLEGKKVPLYGDGQNVREYIYPSDHCQAVDLVLHKGQGGAVYNIGTGEEKLNIDVVQLLLEFLGRGPEMIEHVKDRPGHDRRYAIDAAKIRNELGWRAQVTFVDGLRQTVQWYRENESWWKKLKSGEYLEYYRRQYQTQN
ncbi:MAG: dTDP-glucose 4,6-dehydratase [Candidatus Magasanikbacteria bacterium]|nr:dTDP-glucose 4,6-dehydratase [Candidatus Magasanikbacteria bacterium]